MLVVGNDRGQIAPDVLPDIDSYQVNQAESGRFGSADCWAGNGVDLFNAVLVLQDVIHGEPRPTGKQAVGNEVWSILGRHHAFTEAVFEEVTDEVDHGREGHRGRDNLYQF